MPSVRSNTLPHYVTEAWQRLFRYNTTVYLSAYGRH